MPTRSSTHTRTWTISLGWTTRGSFRAATMTNRRRFTATNGRIGRSNPAGQEFPAGGIPKLIIHEIEPFREFEVLGRKVLPLTIDHGWMQILGFRTGDLAYCTDTKRVPPETLEHLYGLETLIIGCLRYEPHPTHMGLDEVLELVEKIQPKRVFFTHIGHKFDHATLSSELPPHIQPAYDGLRLTEVF